MHLLKYTILLWMLLCNSGILFSQRIDNFDSIKFHENSFYIVCRGTKQKMGFIAEKFNLKDKKITHVGIGIVENGKLLIYNVMNDEGDASALLIQKTQDFTAIPDIFYFSVWEYQSCAKQIEKLKGMLQSYTLKPIAFDLNFNETDDDKLYCSEFCAKVLRQFNSKLFHFPLTNKKLDAFYAKILERKTLHYYPVDFFETNRDFHKVYEQFY